MSRYIDADLLQEDFKEDHGGKRSLMIDTQPTADVVEVVRCKDCRFFDSVGCAMEDIVVYPNDYCSYGERADA